jgi:hypothetical protein
MKNIQYIDLLKESFNVTWKNRFLWLLGFFILLGSVGSNLNVSGDSSSQVESGVQIFSTLIKDNPILFAFFGVLVVVIILALFILRIVAIAGIIKAINDVNLYKQLSIRAILKEGRRYLWRLLMLEFIVGFALVFVVIVLAAPVIYLFSIKATLFAYLVTILAVLIVTPLVLLAFYLIKYAGMFIVLADEKIRISLEAAHAIFMQNIKDSLIMGIMSIGLGIALVISIIYIFLIFGIVFGILGFIIYLIFAKIGAIIVLVLACLLAVLVVLLFLSWYQSFMYAFWLLFFRQIAFGRKIDTESVIEKIDIEAEVESPTPEAV